MYERRTFSRFLREFALIQRDGNDWITTAGRNQGWKKYQIIKKLFGRMALFVRLLLEVNYV